MTTMATVAVVVVLATGEGEWEEAVAAGEKAPAAVAPPFFGDAAVAGNVKPPQTKSTPTPTMMWRRVTVVGVGVVVVAG
jgi:hypothetical protein